MRIVSVMPNLRRESGVLVDRMPTRLFEVAAVLTVSIDCKVPLDRLYVATLLGAGVEAWLTRWCIHVAVKLASCLNTSGMTIRSEALVEVLSGEGHAQSQIA